MSYKNYIDNDYVAKLEKLHQEKQLLKLLIDSKQIDEPLVIELSGLPRTGKTTTFEQLYDFFKKGGFKISKAEEPADLLKKSMSLCELKNLSDVQFNDRTLEISKNNLINAKKAGSDIIVMDRGIIDNYFWYQLYFNKKLISKEIYTFYLKQLKSDIEMIDKLFLLNANTDVIMKRDYNNSIYIEDRNKTNEENVNNLAIAYNDLGNNLEEFYNDMVRIDTSTISPRDKAILIADETIKSYQKKIR